MHPRISISRRSVHDAFYKKSLWMRMSNRTNKWPIILLSIIFRKAHRIGNQGTSPSNGTSFRVSDYISLLYFFAICSPSPTSLSFFILSSFPLFLFSLSNLLLHPSTKRGTKDLDPYLKDTTSTQIPNFGSPPASLDLDDYQEPEDDPFTEADSFFSSQSEPDE